MKTIFKFQGKILEGDLVEDSNFIGGKKIIYKNEIYSVKIIELFNIIEESEETDVECNEKFLVKKTNKTRTKSLFTYLPLWLNKFVWLKKVTVIERLYIVKNEEFDDGYSYQFYLTEPEEEWKIEAIL